MVQGRKLRELAGHRPATRRAGGVIGLAALSFIAVSCGTFPSAAAAPPAPTPPVAVTPACITAPPEAPPQAPDPASSALLAATQEANAGQSQIESQRSAAASTSQRKELDRSHVKVLAQLQRRLYAIQFPPEQRATVIQLLRAIAGEQTAYIHAAGDPDPMSSSHLKEIDDSTRRTQAASNDLRTRAGLPATKHCT